MIYLLFKSARDSTAFLQLCKFSSKAFGKKKNPGGEIVKKKKEKKKSPQKRFDVENLCNYTKD